MAFKVTIEDAMLTAHFISLDHYVARYSHQPIAPHKKEHCLHAEGQPRVYFDPEQVIEVDNDGASSFKDFEGKDHLLCLYMSRPVTSEDIVIVGGEVLE